MQWFPKVVRGESPSVVTSIALVILLGAEFCALPATAQSQPSQPVAIVEDINGAEAGVGVFDYLEAGRLIRLSAGDILILGYLTSCLRETIHGGAVTIGAEQSSVIGGLVIREDVECDGGFTNLSVAEASQSGAIAFRKGPSSASHGTRADPIKIFSLDPVFVFSQQASELVISRIDQVESELRIPVQQNWVKLADHDVSLGPGGLYEARAGASKLVFEVAPHAGIGGPLVGRVVGF